MSILEEKPDSKQYPYPAREQNYPPCPMHSVKTAYILYPHNKLFMGKLQTMNYLCPLKHFRAHSYMISCSWGFDVPQLYHIAKYVKIQRHHTGTLAQQRQLGVHGAKHRSLGGLYRTREGWRPGMGLVGEQSL